MRYKALALVISIMMLQGCSSMVQEAMGTRTIYPCSMSCGNENITPPKGYVYYHQRVMSIEEFNEITHQHLVIE